MYEKLIKLVRARGYCCIWMFLSVHRQTPTSALVRLAKDEGFKLTARAVRHQRRAFRQGCKSCERLPTCLKTQIQASRNSS